MNTPSALPPHLRVGTPVRGALTALLVTSLVVVLAGCSSSPTTNANPSATVGPEASASASPVDPKPAPEPGDPTGPAGGPAFEPASGGAPAVSRGEEPSLRQVTVPPVTFAEKAAWSDGLEATTQGFSRGTITATGAGAISGAAYITIDVEVQNLSETEVSLDSVVATLLVGEEELPAAPTYDVEGAIDLTGVLAPGAKATGTYAYQVGEETSEGTFYLDIDGDHAVATFSGSFS